MLKIPAHRLILKKMRHYRGWCVPADRAIALDPTDRNIGLTYYHELTHLKYPSWSETRVDRESKRRWSRLSWRDKARLLRQLGKARIGERDD